MAPAAGIATTVPRRWSRRPRCAHRVVRRRARGFFATSPDTLSIAGVRRRVGADTKFAAMRNSLCASTNNPTTDRNLAILRIGVRQNPPYRGALQNDELPAPR